MYLLGAESEIDWILGKTESTVSITDLDIVVISPDGSHTYMTAPVAVDRFTAPNVTTDGQASYLFTPNLEGRYKLRLVTGVAGNYTVLSKVEMHVFDNTLVVNPYSPEIGKPVPYDVSYFLQGYMVPNELVGSYVATRDIVFAVDSDRHVAQAEVAPSTVIQKFNILHDGVIIGEVTFPIGIVTGTITMAQTLLVRGEKLQVQVKGGSIDWTIRDITITLVGCCSVSACELL